MTRERADLTLVHGFEPGLTRARIANGFVYRHPDGSAVEDAAELERIAALAIPPAWNDVWVSADPSAHLQATGIDARGRKQYRYHAKWRQDRDALKFHDMEVFGRAQPELRARVAEELGAEGQLGHGRVLALSLRLLDVGLFRVGSDRYARENHHYGLTTLQMDQVTVNRERAVFDYVGKAGKRQRLAVTDRDAVPALAALRRRRSGPGELIVFRGGRGWTRVHADDVNNYLRYLAGAQFSAKEYRTWNATVIAATALAAQRPTQARAASAASRAAADALGNTPAVARQAYIDPRVLRRYADGDVVDLQGLPADPWRARAAVERRVLELLGTR
ncbi:MAG TPA: DNA topoisomerase IB [Solirubrobacteraceae bacterium]|jgi:DNA topoisomerase-1|nr:DNA topoisomerase IB [Solirubrobacteraceae bacterium]